MESIMSSTTLDEANYQEYDLLHMAAKSGHEELMLTVLSRCPSLIDKQNKSGDNLLHVAARAGHLGVVELLTRFFHYLPSSESSSDENRATAAVEKPSERSLTEIETIIDIHENDDNGITNCVLQPSPPQSSQSESRGIIENGTSSEPASEEILWRTKNNDGNTALHEALRNKQEVVALYLLDLDSGLVELANTKDETPLYLAAKAGFVRVLNKIIEVAGNKPNTRTAHPNGQTPFHAAVFAKSQESIRVLYEWIPELIQNKDAYQKTPLHYATEEDSLEIMHLLLELDPSSACVEDKKGLTPLLVAVRKGRPASVQAILHACPTSKMRTFINKPDQEGNTPLHLATMGQKYEHVQALLSSKHVNLKAENKLKKTASDLCRSDDGVLSVRQGQIEDALMQHGKTEEDLTALINTMSTLAALLASITFLAALQSPGGYKADGSPSLIHKAALKVFVFFDIIAFCCSMVALFFLILGTTVNKASQSALIRATKGLVICAVHSTTITFIAGLYGVMSIESKSGANGVCIICVMVFIFGPGSHMLLSG